MILNYTATPVIHLDTLLNNAKRLRIPYTSSMHTTLQTILAQKTHSWTHWTKFAEENIVHHWFNIHPCLGTTRWQNSSWCTTNSHCLQKAKTAKKEIKDTEAKPAKGIQRGGLLGILRCIPNSTYKGSTVEHRRRYIEKIPWKTIPPQFLQFRQTDAVEKEVKQFTDVTPNLELEDTTLAKNYKEVPQKI